MTFSDRDWVVPPGAGIMQHMMLQMNAKTINPNAVVRDSIPAGAPVDTAVACVTGSWVVTNHALLPGRNKVARSNFIGAVNRTGAIVGIAGGG